MMSSSGRIYIPLILPSEAVSRLDACLAVWSILNIIPHEICVASTANCEDWTLVYDHCQSAVCHSINRVISLHIQY